MTNAPEPSSSIRIHTPCPKRWEELTGDGARRYCGECKLHVHDARQITKAEARELVEGATTRVCMRIEHDERGEPVFLDTPTIVARRSGSLARAARWAMTAVAGVLAACTGSTTATPATPTSPAGVAPTTTTMGKVCSPLVGDVAVPPPTTRVMLGEATAPAVPPSPNTVGLGGVGPDGVTPSPKTPRYE